MIKLSDKFVLRNVYEKMILMPIKQNGYTDSPIALNSTAGLILKVLLEVNDISETECQVMHRLGIKNQEIENEISSFIDTLFKYSIVEMEG